ITSGSGRFGSVAGRPDALSIRAGLHSGSRGGRCDEQLRRAEQDELVARCIAGDFRVLLGGATREAKCISQPAIVVNDRNVSAYEEEFSFGVIVLWCVRASLYW